MIEIIEIDGKKYIKGSDLSTFLITNKKLIDCFGNDNIEKSLLQIIESQELLIDSISGLNTYNTDLKRNISSLHKKLANINFEQKNKVTEKTMKRGNNISKIIAALMFVLIILQFIL